MVFLLLGCVGAVDLGRATVLAPGEIEVAVGGGAVTRGPLGSAGSTSAGEDAVVGGAVGLRGGLAPRVELGATVGTVGVTGLSAPYGGVDAKVELTAPAARTHVAVDPRFVGASNTLTGAPSYVVDLPVLVGWDVGASQVIVAPHAAAVLVPSPQGDVVSAYGALGLRAGWAIRVGPVDLIPAVEGLWTRGLGADADDATGDVLLGGGLTVAVPLQ